jgi:hypothetical protein
MTNDESNLKAQMMNFQNGRPVRRFGHLHFDYWPLIRHSSFVIRHFQALALVAAAASLQGCYERKQTAILNPDGSGRMTLTTLVAVPAQGVGQEKPTALTFGRQWAASLINNTQGVDAWADVEITATPPPNAGKAQITATAYFPDLNKLKFDMPIEFVWKRDLEGATLTVQRTRSAARSAITTDAQLKEVVAQAQKQYRDDQQLAWHMQLNAFRLDMIFELPGELGDTNLLGRDGQKVALVLDGKKAAEALDKFFADTAALTAMFKAGQDLPANDDLLLQSMYGSKGPVFAATKLAVDAKPAFDYKLEMRSAQLQQAAMLQAAGVELIPKFIVTPPAATRAAGGAGATAPARGR